MRQVVIRKQPHGLGSALGDFLDDPGRLFVIQNVIDGRIEQQAVGARHVDGQALGCDNFLLGLQTFDGHFKFALLGLQVVPLGILPLDLRQKAFDVLDVVLRVLDAVLDDRVDLDVALVHHLDDAM